MACVCGVEPLSRPEAEACPRHAAAAGRRRQSPVTGSPGWATSAPAPAALSVPPATARRTHHHTRIPHHIATHSLRHAAIRHCKHCESASASATASHGCRLRHAAAAARHTSRTGAGAGAVAGHGHGCHGQPGQGPGKGRLRSGTARQAVGSGECGGVGGPWAVAWWGQAGRHVAHTWHMACGKPDIEIFWGVRAWPWALGPGGRPAPGRGPGPGRPALGRPTSPTAM